jgi:hypothetical protein
MKPDDMRLGEEWPEVELSSIGEAEGWRPSSDNLPSEEDGEKSNQSGTSSPRAVGWERVGEKGMLPGSEEVATGRRRPGWGKRGW